MLLNEGFEIHSTLNKKLWDVNTNKLLPEVKSKIIEITSAFEDFIKTPIQICDIQLVGSNASYNYTDESDLDVHIIADFEVITTEVDILKKLYETRKNDFNSTYDISIHGVSIEMYIQDVNSGIVSNGIYSVLDDEWIKEPKPIKKIIQHNIEDEFNKWKKKINRLVAEGDSDKIADAISTLRLVRRNSIAADGEYGAGNQLFKEIRASGLLSKLRDAKVSSKSKELSLENLDEMYYCNGSFINKFNK